MKKKLKMKLFRRRTRSALAKYFRGIITEFELENRLNWAAAKYMGGWRWLNQASNTEILALKRSVIQGFHMGMRR